MSKCPAASFHSFTGNLFQAEVYFFNCSLDFALGNKVYPMSKGKYSLFITVI